MSHQMHRAASASSYHIALIFQANFSTRVIFAGSLPPLTNQNGSIKFFRKTFESGIQSKQNKTKHQHQNYQISTNSPSKLKLNRRMTTKQLLHLTPKYYAYPTHPKLFEERLEFLNSASAPTSLQRQALPPTTNSYENP
ncbi:hypothetical protein BofuT4_P015860.1 [Botrytis cinerea T4]|uniref:Uncharacterized protein n=1 Tax=Botryotinia fuckeliana (strain T4) TaxID=999810 RepID=G2YHU3_BOTF4|nr:hypothetical protein BofuT4_P015860.1 [Botrytis cinerea T4]